MSGTIALQERPDGARLLADAQAGAFGMVVVYRVDRFARSLRILLDGYNELEAAGIAFKSATEPFDTSTSMGKFFFQLLGSMAELERATILERMGLGRDRVTRLGQWLNGPVPFGYMIDTQGCLLPSTRWYIEHSDEALDAARRQLEARLPQAESTVDNDVHLKQTLIRDLLREVVAEADGTRRCHWYFGEERVADRADDMHGYSPRCVAGKMTCPSQGSNCAR